MTRWFDLLASSDSDGSETAQDSNERYTQRNDYDETRNEIRVLQQLVDKVLNHLYRLLGSRDKVIKTAVEDCLRRDTVPDIQALATSTRFVLDDMRVHHRCPLVLRRLLVHVEIDMVGVRELWSGVADMGIGEREL